MGSLKRCRQAYIVSSFEIKGVPYYDVLPTEPIERPRQTLLPMSLVGDWVREYIDEFNSKVEAPKKAMTIDVLTIILIYFMGVEIGKRGCASKDFFSGNSGFF